MRYIDGPLLVGPQMFVPALLALFDLRQHATEAAARRRLRLELVPRHTQCTRIARIERAALERRRFLRASFRASRADVIPGRGATFRMKQIGIGRTVDQRIATRSVGSTERKRAGNGGGGRKTKRMMHRALRQVTCNEKKRQITGWLRCDRGRDRGASNDAQEGWLDCGCEFELFHRYNNMLS
ncbi:hypothetical protein [Burkholderia vietnamiensis]|uniref:hypothetical protein n=1 Tax=Burkholderia vietnamiensis TaxID=60552 RepID=UPI0012D8ABC1|nr:hypothetical protein [Burkholderia vietnamiensis]